VSNSQTKRCYGVSSTKEEENFKRKKCTNNVIPVINFAVPKRRRITFRMFRINRAFTFTSSGKLKTNDYFNTGKL